MCCAVLCCLQDIFALMPRYSQRPANEEIINDPTVTKHYWRYRYGAHIASSMLWWWWWE
jgi:4-alpha-glucanotransferase